MNAEEWRPVVGAPDYEVSNRGRVRSWKKHPGLPVPRQMQPVPHDGYHRLTVFGTGVRRQAFIHRLVAEAFIGPQPVDKPVIRHLDGNKTHNVPSNLAYGTVLENELDKIRHGTHTQLLKTHCPARHPYDEANTYITPRGWRMCRECARTRDRARRAAA